jgi:uroporphyrinogen-III decarboxylase
MKPRDRVLAVLNHELPDRIPRFEIWIDAFIDELGDGDEVRTYVNVGQDCILMPSSTPEGSNSWKSGIDEFGRVWEDGFYTNGAINTEEKLARYSPPADYAVEFFDPGVVKTAQTLYPDHCHIFGTHVGPFTASYMAMGFENLFINLLENPSLVHQLLVHRTRWCIALFQEAIRLGAEVIVLGEDSGHSQGPMISPAMWEEHILPYHLQIVDELKVPVIWHSDGDIRELLPYAVQAGFVGVHGLDPISGIDLQQVKAEYGQKLVLIGNVDVRVLCESDFNMVRSEVERCIAHGGPGGGYMIASCNSIFKGMNLEAVTEMFRYESEVGLY